MSLLLPPSHVAPAKLFRILIAAPRARQPVALDFLDAGGAERGVFCVLALPPLEEAAARMITLPVWVEPVNVIFATSGCSTSAAPVGSPYELRRSGIA